MWATSPARERDADSSLLLDLGKRLCGPLLTDLKRQRSAELELKAQGKGTEKHGKKRLSAHPSFTAKQMVLRSLLGCLRLESHLGSHSAGGETELRLTRVLEDSLGKTQSKNMRNTASALTGSTQSLSLLQQGKHFVALLISMHASDDKGGERGDCTLVVALLGEILGALAPGARMQLTTHLLKMLHDRLVE